MHVMSKKAANAIAKHRQEGAVVYGEVIAVSLAKDGRVYYDKDWQKVRVFEDFFKLVYFL